MLNRLSIKNFAIIEDIEVNFFSGLNVLMGETGAGKSILIDALGLLQGNRSSLDKIRNGENKAFIEGEFIISDSLKEEINLEFEDLLEDNTLLVSRSLDINGKSICKVNFQSVPLSLLKKIMSSIIDIHSQHKDNSFFDEDKQITFLDAFILKTGISSSSDELSLNGANIYESYKDVYTSFLLETKKLSDLKKLYENLEDREILDYQFNELDKANVQENELENIEDELQRLKSFEKMKDVINNFQGAYDEASSSLYNAKKCLGSITDDSFEKDIEDFNDKYYELEDVVSSIKNKFSSFEESIYKIDELQERRSLLKSLARKYGGSSSSIRERFEEIKTEIDLYDNYEYTISQQEKVINKIEKNLLDIASSLSKLRKKYGEILVEKINIQLKDLLLENAEFKIEQKESSFNKFGKDEIRFLLCANKGGKFLSLSSTASLGETSRLNLALKTVFNEIEPVGTIIFDEIDTGISGKAAVATSYKLQQIAKSSQTIIISHLPQVASIGKHHFFVSKKVEDGITKSHIHEMDEKELVNEIARMLSGENISEESLKASKQLIDSINID